MSLHFSKTIYLVAVYLWLIISSYVFWANLYNLESAELSQELEKINTTYQLNTDVVVLSTWDTCASRQDFSDCIRDELDDGVDLVFVINNELRKMETSIRDSALDAVPKAEALAFEQQAVPYLQAGDEYWAIWAYLQWLQNFLDTRCQFYKDTTCTVTSITESVRLYQEQLAEQWARQKLIYMQVIVWLIILSWLLIWGIQKWQTYQRNKKNRALLHQLKDHSNFLRININQDTQIFEKDKNNLLTELDQYDEKLEHLFTSSSDYIHIQISNEDYPTYLSKITSKYENMLSLIGKTPEIRKKIAEIKKMDM